MNKFAFSFLISFLFFSSFSQAATSNKESIFAKEKGFFTCAGESSAPLFKQDCLELTIDRVCFGGQIVYEGTCLDSNGKKFRLSCSNFVFEPETITTNTKKNYFEQ